MDERIRPVDMSFEIISATFFATAGSESFAFSQRTPWQNQV
jgi:hypothetical protein